MTTWAAGLLHLLSPKFCTYCIRILQTLLSLAMKGSPRKREKGALFSVIHKRIKFHAAREGLLLWQQLISHHVLFLPYFVCVFVHVLEAADRISLTLHHILFWNKCRVSKKKKKKEKVTVFSSENLDFNEDLRFDQDTYCMQDNTTPYAT